MFESQKKSIRITSIPVIHEDTLLLFNFRKMFPEKEKRFKRNRHFGKPQNDGGDYGKEGYASNDQ